MDQDSSLHSGNHEEPSGLIGRQLLKMQNAVVMTMLRIRQKVVQGFVIFFVVFLLLWISAFLYGSLYYSYMPNAAFSTSVHYYYRCVCEVLSSCPRRDQTNYCIFEPLSLCYSHAAIHVLVYRTDCDSPASFWCSYPVANVSLMRNRKHVCTDMRVLTKSDCAIFI